MDEHQNGLVAVAEDVRPDVVGLAVELANDDVSLLDLLGWEPRVLQDFQLQLVESKLIKLVRTFIVSHFYFFNI